MKTLTPVATSARVDKHRSSAISLDIAVGPLALAALKAWTIEIGSSAVSLEELVGALID